MDFKKVDKKYRPVPFWSWNERLRPEETRRQIAMLDEAGMGGFFMHARGGLQTPYMGEEWFENVSAAIDEANKRGMHAWAYDENGWPSGFGNGLVNGRGVAYQQKYLRVKTFTPDLEDPRGPEVICCFENYCFYYDVNPYYVDTLDGKVIKAFLDEIYEPYYAKYKDTFDGFFTDEPQISRNGIPWSFILPEEYEKAYGEKLYDHLIELFLEQGDYRRTRMQFWRLVTELFSKNYMKQIYDWCESHHLKFTGHLVLEESMLSQLVSNGACMPHYEYLHIPGMDWLCRPIYRCLTQHQLASAAAQTGKRQVLSETFALCGHNVSFEELGRNYEWMTVRGINLMCQHLMGYSTRGLRKRDYPPAMYYQQPWWKDYPAFIDTYSRIGMLLAEGRIRFDTLVLHTQTSAWICYNDRDNKDLGTYNEALLDVIDTLERKHIPFHLGDEILMSRHARVEGKELVIGEQRYRNVILPPHIAFFPETEALLAAFRQNGGNITTAEELEANDVTDNPELTYTVREFDGFTLHYFVNSTDRAQTAHMPHGGKRLDPSTGEVTPFDGDHVFPPMSSLLLIDDGTPQCAHTEAPARKPVLLDGAFTVAGELRNALTLDRCTYWFDGVLQEEDGYVLNIVQRAAELGHGVDLRCAFRVQCDYLPQTLCLACETPEIFSMEINGQAVEKKDCGYFTDAVIRLLDVSPYFRKGENTIVLTTRLEQPQEFYENLEKSKAFESEKNKLTYQTEVEAMYLVGDFGVRFDGEYREVDHRAAFAKGTFTVTEPPKTLTLCHIERQGLPFFCGELTLQKKLTLDSTDFCLSFAKTGINAIRVRVNGQAVRTLIQTPFCVDISAYLHEGENTLELTLVNNLRNLMGPLHHVGGELLACGPSDFYAEPCIWNGYRGGAYTPDYCLVEMSMENQ